MKPTTIRVKQGVVVIRRADILRRGPGVVAILLDMHTKRASYCGSGSTDEIPCIALEADEETLHLHETATGDTYVEFSDFIGWDVWSCEVRKYTAYVCLVHRDERVPLWERFLRLLRGVPKALLWPSTRLGAAP